MTSHEDFDTAALFHIPQRKQPDSNTGLDVTLYTWGRTELIDAVRRQGVDLHITRGRDAFDDPLAVDVLNPVIDTGSYTSAHALGSRALTEYGAVRSVAGTLEHVRDIPILTDTRVRKIASDKLATVDLLSGLELHEGAHLVSPGQDLSELLASIKGDNVVLKPRRGSRSEGVIVVDKKTAEEAFKSRDNKDDDYIVEEKLDFSTPFPGSIRGYDEANQARLELANKDRANKELRTMYFGNGKYCYIARAARAGEADFRADDWVYIDQSTVPDDIIDIDQRVVQEIEERSGIKEFHIAIDKTFATTDTNKDPKWRVMEINAGEPQLVRSDQQPTIAAEHANLIAEQIARIARKRSLQ